MSNEEMKELATCMLKVFSAHRMAEFDRLVEEILAPEYTLHDPDMPDFGRGPEAVKRFMHTMVEQSPDVHIVINDVLAEGDRVATRFTVYSTNPETGTPNTIEVMCFSRIADGKVAEEWQVGVPVKNTVPAQPA
jgi:predicted SnoaL-like aldol condensation-catalyzing enzyme